LCWSCTHVWNYARQFSLFLHWSTLCETEFNVDRADGHQTLGHFDFEPEHGFHAASDGQLENAKIYRNGE
jgi:hypothetical protein